MTHRLEIRIDKLTENQAGYLAVILAQLPALRPYEGRTYLKLSPMPDADNGNATDPADMMGIYVQDTQGGFAWKLTDHTDTCVYCVNGMLHPVQTED